MHLTTFVLLFTLNLTMIACLSSEQKCELCQIVISSTYWHFGRIPSKRQFVNRLGHVCKRYSNYRRRCLLMLKKKKDIIVEEIEKDAFKPLNICTTLKECKGSHSPLIDVTEPQLSLLVVLGIDNTITRRDTNDSQ